MGSRWTPFTFPPRQETYISNTARNLIDSFLEINYDILITTMYFHSEIISYIFNEWMNQWIN